MTLNHEKTKQVLHLSWYVLLWLHAQGLKNTWNLLKTSWIVDDFQKKKKENSHYKFALCTMNNERCPNKERALK